MADERFSGTRLSGGLAQAVAEEFSLQASVGGVRGLLESVIPVVVFSGIYTVTRQLVPSVSGAVAVSVLLVVARIVARQPVSSAVSGLFGVALGAGIALATGRPINFFLSAIIKNVFFGLLYAISVMVRWPLVGVFLGFMLREQTHWRTVPARRRVYAQATWVWAAMFGIRLAVEIPLYLHGQVTSLGVAQAPLGPGLYALVLLLTWLIVRRVPVARPPEGDVSAPADALAGFPADAPPNDPTADAHPR